MRRSVDGVDVDAGAVGVREPRDRRHVGAGADDVARGGEGDPAGALGELVGDGVRLELEALAMGVYDAQRRARALRRELPRADVRVLVQAGDEELVARPEAARDRSCEAERQRRHARAEDDSLRVGAEERSDRRTGVVGHRPRTARGGERPAVVGERAGAEVLADGGDRGVDGLRPAGCVEARPAVAEAGEAVAVEAHRTILAASPRAREPHQYRVPGADGGSRIRTWELGEARFTAACV